MEQTHVILLKKNLKKISEDFNDTWITNKKTHWIALGHFDDIYIYHLENRKDFFSRIQEDKANVFKHNDECAYYHPLYLIPDQSIEIAENDNENPFIAIVRIHFPKSLHLTEQFDKVRNALLEKLNSSNLSYQIYYATEFSDMVLDVRSKQLNILMNMVLRFRELTNINIGKLYTYFGINFEYLKNSNDLPVEDDIIPLFSMRFSGYNMEIVNEQIKLIKRHLMQGGDSDHLEYCINGIDDLMLIFRNRPTATLIKLYRSLLFSQKYKAYRKSESATRIGVEITIDISNFQSFIPDSQLIQSSICADLPNLCKDISDLISSSEKNYFGWFHAIVEVSNSLVRMSNTPIMDEVVYLIAPGVRAFLLNVKDYLSRHDYRPFSDSGYLYDYVESCSYYIEQLMRIEGQLSHNPEIRPVIYDIPVFMLEYIIAFLNKVSKLLKHDDSNKAKRNTVFMLVPRPCDRVNALEIFPAKKGIPGLVHIQIPENTLYSPTEVFSSLCHEISHYVGETYRNRSKRKQAYAHAVAVLLVNKLFKSNDILFLEMFKGIFLDSLNEKDTPTIAEMNYAIVKNARAILEQDNCMNNILTKYYAFAKSKSLPPAKIDFINDEDIKFLFYRVFKENLEDIGTLFREVFADICMLNILDLDINIYIESLLQELEIHRIQANYSNEIFAIRIYVTLTAMKKEVQYNNGRYNTTWEYLKGIIYKIKEEIDNETNCKYHFHIPASAIFALLEYAKLCNETMVTSLYHNNDISEVREMYTNLFDNNFQYKKILQGIEQCRENMIQKED